MDLPTDRLYTPQHEWAKLEETGYLIGLTAFATDQLGDIVYAHLARSGTQVYEGQPIGEVESTKSVSDVYSPITGWVIDSNPELTKTPEVINEDPYDRGWLVRIEATSEPQGLLTPIEYSLLID